MKGKCFLTVNKTAFNNHLFWGGSKLANIPILRTKKIIKLNILNERERCLSLIRPE